MYGDISRDTFDPRRNYSRVLMQQGRVQLDADWNEQVSILLHQIRTTTRDLIGPHGGPENHCGFEVVTRAASDSWTDDEWKELEPDDGRRNSLREALSDGDIVLRPGRYYVDGILIELQRPLLFSEQLGYPFGKGMEISEFADSSFALYLDVWETEVNHHQDPRLREVALGPADTCSRVQVVWQVKAWPIHDAESDPFADAAPPMGELIRGQLPTLRVRARREARTSDLCAVAPEARYRGIENHLYRVEVHAVGNDGATFKWSRDNGSVTFPILSLSGGTAVLGSLGNEACSVLKAGDWVEITDNHLAAGAGPVPLVMVEQVNRETLTVTLPGATVGYDEKSRHLQPILRRWDHKGDEKTGGAVRITEDDHEEKAWLRLEDGIEVKFAAGEGYHPGDYWIFPARVATGDVEWPQNQNKPQAIPRHGPRHNYAPFWAFVDGDSSDRRCSFPPLCPLR